MRIEVSLDGVMQQFATQIAQAGDRAPEMMAGALNAGGSAMRVRTIEAETAQTGLAKRTISKAQREFKATRARLEYEIEAAGGNVRLKYFRPRETRAGVSASPWNSRRVYAGSFMKAGWPQGSRWAKRKAKPNWNGQVFQRTGGKTRTGMDEFEHAKSGLFIPTEMVTGQTAGAFHASQPEVMAEVTRQIGAAFGAS